MPRKHRIDLPVILRNTGERGKIVEQLPPQNGVNRYRVEVDGRHAIPGRPQGQGRSVEVLETVLGVGMTPEQKSVADSRLRDITVRPLSTPERNQLRVQYLAIRNNPNTSDHKIAEAIRVIEAVEAVQAE